MRDKFLYLLFIILLSSQSLALNLSPTFKVGIESNDNIDQTKIPISDFCSKLYGDLSLNSSFGPDTLIDFSLSFSSKNFFNKNYGSLTETFATAGFDYDINEKMTFGFSGFISSYSDTALTTNNYNSSAIMPDIKFKISPLTLTGFSYRNKKLTYVNTSENIIDQRGSFYISHKVSNNLNLNTRALISQSNSSITTNNFSSNGINGEMIFNVSPSLSISLYYMLDNLTYPNWYTFRNDKKTIFSFDGKYNISKDLEFNAKYLHIQNNSTDTDLSFSNNIVYAGITWKTSFGELFPNGIKSEIFYYFDSGLKALDEEKWSIAEKQFKKVVFYEDNSDIAHFYLGYAMSKQKKFNQSVIEFEKAITLNPNNIEAHYLLAYNYIKLGEFEKAKKILGELLSKSDNDKIKEILKSISK